MLVPHEERWGIYALDLAANTVELIYSASRKVSSLRLNSIGDRFAFSQKVDGGDNSHEEICTLRVDGTDFARLTNNTFWDLYPAWSPDGAQIAFLSNRDGNLDIFVMDAVGGNVRKLYDSGGHDADIDWRNGRIAFTRDSRIWLVDDEGTNAEQVTDPPRAGQWGNANLPFGDYDPRILTTVTQRGVPVRTLARRVDGAFPSAVNPIAVWEIKEYYYTTTFGSRVADGVYETLLDGMEIEELRSTEGIHVKHFLMIDAHYTWWECGRSYLCRIIDMLHMGYVDEVLFGREVVERLPEMVKEWVSLLNR